ncbi:hypothetical protein ACFL6S_18500 [Candidatus Poribacteria bacterium]
MVIKRQIDDIGRILIPKGIRDLLGMQPGEIVFMDIINGERAVKIYMPGKRGEKK